MGFGKVWALTWIALDNPVFRSILCLRHTPTRRTLMLTRKVLSLTLVATLVAATSLPAAAQHRGNHNGGFRNGGHSQNFGDRYGRGNWGGGFPGHRGYQQNWGGGYRGHRGGAGTGLAIGLGVLGFALGAAAASQPTYAYPPPTAHTSCSVGGCYIWNGQWWVWHPRY